MNTGNCLERAVRASLLAPLLLLSDLAFSQTADTAGIHPQAEVFLRRSFACYALNDCNGFIALCPDYRQLDSMMAESYKDYSKRNRRELGQDTALFRQIITGELLELYARNYQRAGKAGIHWQGLQIVEWRMTYVIPPPGYDSSLPSYDLNFLIRDSINGKIKAGRLLNCTVYKGRLIPGRVSVILDAPKGLTAWIEEQNKGMEPPLRPAPTIRD